MPAELTRPDQKPVQCRMAPSLAGRLNLAAIARTRRPMAAVNLSVSADMIHNETSQDHALTKAQTGARRIDVNQARSGSSEIRSADQRVAGPCIANLPVSRARPADDRPEGSALSEGAALGGEELASCFGRVCRSPQNSTAANTTNIATTQTETSKELVGMRLISCDGGSMPARLDRGFDLNQTHRHWQDFEFQRFLTLQPWPQPGSRPADGHHPRR